VNRALGDGKPLDAPASSTIQRKGTPMLRLLVHLQVLAASTAHHLEPDRRHDPTARAAPRFRGDVGQTTAEYALVLLGAVAIAALLITWASKSGAVGRLFDAVLSHVIGSVT